jgi:hypothetical protein
VSDGAIAAPLCRSSFAFEVWADGYSASEYATAVMAFKPT